jgi:uncharacterized protein YjbI with pentapeptide repeats
MTDYSNQNITGAILTNVNLTGANFTNTIATNVNFTNAIITNATFRNTLITGATLTGITFSNLQKGQLLLRAANLNITAINNLTSLSISELRTIQPAISLRSLNFMQTVTVAVPNNTGQGYNVAITPILTQAVCIFVAINQNIVISTGITTIKTIRSNGTVIQDIDSLNAIITHLIIGSVPYQVSIGNGDGVIMLIPIDLNQYKVNESGLGDIISLNRYPRYNLYWGNGTSTTAKVTFNLGATIDLRFNKIQGTAKLRATSTFNYPMMVFNTNHTYPSVNNYVNEMASNQVLNHTTAPYPGTVAHYAYHDRSMCFSITPPVTDTISNDIWYILNFEINGCYDVATNTTRQMVCRGNMTYVIKAVGSLAQYKYTGMFERTNDLTTITHIGFGAYDNNSGALKGANLSIEVIPLGPYSVQSTA